MNYITRLKQPSSLLHPLYSTSPLRTLTKVRLKWCKNRFLDHIIETHTELKAACVIKDAILRTTTASLTSKILNNAQRVLGLTVPTLRFVRRYPTLFKEFKHPKYNSLICFELTDMAKLLHQQELKVYEEGEGDIVDRLCRVLMMTQSRMVPMQSLHPLKFDLGLPDDFDKNLVTKFPHYFQVVKGVNGKPYLKLIKWREELAVSELQKMNEKRGSDEIDGDGGGRDSLYKDFKRGKAALQFPMNYPRCYGEQTKVKAWMDDFHKLPYISPYEDCRSIDPNSDLMEKRVIGVLHEFLNLTVYKKTKRNNLRSLREELNLPHRFTRIFTRYPGIFYLSLKCKTTTVVLKEGYRRGKLLNTPPLARQREKYHHVMRTGLIYRNRAVNILPQLENLENNDEENTIDDGGSEEEEYEMADDNSEDEASDGEDD